MESICRREIMMKKKVILPLILAAACILSACGQGSAPAQEGSAPSSPMPEETAPLLSQALPESGNTISVNSSEAVSVVPDIAQIVYSVRSQAKEPADCQQKNSQSVSSVIGLLKELGVNESSIRTSDYYMNPIYDYSGNTAKVTGYEAVISLTVSDLPIDGLDELLARSVQEGVNTIQSITYMASSYDESYKQALAKAVETAHQKAEVLASASGRSVGEAVKITETSGYSEARYEDYARAGMYSATAKQELMADTASISPGQIEVNASIVIEYELY